MYNKGKPQKFYLIAINLHGLDVGGLRKVDYRYKNLCKKAKVCFKVYDYVKCIRKMCT